MKLNKLSIAVLFATSAISTSIFASGNNGELHFSGQVVNAPCNIESESTKQEVPFGQLSRASLEAGNAAEKDIAIKLKECNFDEFSKDTEGKWVAVKDIKITFGGKNYVGTDKEFLGTTGTASNIGIQIKDFKFDEAKSVMNQIRNKQGENVLEFTALAKRVDGTTPVTEGEFSSIADFKITYE
ncbi:fimbrial protein [Providencia rettgeri]|uniref:fimbrial protein n=1 Tax=Providencia rettgeri TaxID=587 RepID=UPI001B37ACB6|nr:fimbrial protein [Providencia rettgeri]EHZ7766226.1 type 1 fimbrial protein [Providencia rettgeri]EIJ7169368.1 type 1 fimbrial protein [Providencia rettgeri]EJD6049405.1 type 1 fimbrial protein [Providencia rettgeri]ELR5091912.1 type 1 fimbrial protein [Providencia rettgeri]ELR5104749.1 type 1 fimbrial protein [Providencia rettgeri]